MAQVRVLFDPSDQIGGRRLLDALLDRDFVADEARTVADLKKARAVVVLWSPAAIDNAELVRAAAHARGRGVLLQAKLKPCDVPSRFGERDGVVLAGWTGDAADVRFQTIAAGVRSLIDGVDPGGARPPEGLGWTGRRWRRTVLLVAGGVAALAGAIGAVQNLKTGKDWVCRVEALSGPCRRAGLTGPRAPDVLTRLEGVWGAAGCRDRPGRLNVAEDRKSFRLVFPDHRSRGRIDSLSESSVAVTQLEPQSEAGLEYRIQVEEGRLLLKTANGNDISELYRCGD
jgi:hypothetical protein